MAESELRFQQGQYISNYPEIAFAVEVARKIAKAVQPVYGIKQKDVPVNQVSHDFNYALDVRAEKAVKIPFQRAWRKGLVYGFVTEDQGLVLPTGMIKPQWIFLIDPVDGSRPANIGAEMACVNIALVKGNNPNPTLGDVEKAATLAIKENKLFIAQAGQGIFEVIPGRSGGILIEVKSRENTTSSLKDVSLVYETYSMSAELTGIVIDPLLRDVSFKTEYPSGSYSALSLVRGQNELHVDLRRRLVLDFPDLPVMLKPNSKALMPMDIAPQYLMLQELGMTVTDANGKSLANTPLWHFENDGSWSSQNQLSWVAAATPLLHQQAMAKIEEGFSNLSKKLKTVK